MAVIFGLVAADEIQKGSESRNTLISFNPCILDVFAGYFYALSLTLLLISGIGCAAFVYSWMCKKGLTDYSH